MTLRDDLLPLVDELRGMPVDFGVRRFAVTIRRRMWTGSQPGQGNATNQDIALSPLPRVRDAFSVDKLAPLELEYIRANSDAVRGRLYKVDKITPAYFDGNNVRLGGYTAQELRLWPNPDPRHIEPLVVLVGDDGLAAECVQVTFEQDRAFGYTMLVKEQDKPRTPLMSMAITPSPVTLAVAATKQLTLTGTFVGLSTSVITGLALWATSSSAVATIDPLGKLTAVGTGTATITAVMPGGIRATISVTVS